MPWKEGMRLSDLESLFSAPAGIITLGKVDHTLCELDQMLPREAQQVELLDTNDVDGRRVYMRSLSYVFLVAVAMCFPEDRAYIEHSISGCTYCTIRRGKTQEIIQPDSRMKNRLRACMRELITQDLPIVRESVRVEDAIQLFQREGREAKAQILQKRRTRTVSLYHLGAYTDHFYGFMLPNTGRLETFDLEIYRNGLILAGVARGSRTEVRNFVPQYKLSDIYTENERWSQWQGISFVSDLNAAIRRGETQEIIEMSEQLQAGKIADLAETIQREHKRICFVAAPSCSGKTSFAHKLRIALRTFGLRPQTLSLDDYFVNREDTPLDEEGNPDFESLDAIDVPRFVEDLQRLLRGEAIERLRFDFVEGKRQRMGEAITLRNEDPLIIEGIHGLNPKLTDQIAEKEQFRIYLSVITHLNLDAHNRIPTSDLRLMRRMARDIRTRDRSPVVTIAGWQQVRRGEERNIFPYQERAHALYNSSFLYEISVLKPIIEPLLKEIPRTEPAYIEASRLLSILQYFEPVTDTAAIGPTSILREFIGGSLLAVS